MSDSLKEMEKLSAKRKGAIFPFTFQQTSKVMKILKIKLYLITI